MNEVELRSKIERDLRDYPNWDMSRKRTYAAMMYAMYHSDEPSPSLNSIIDQSLEKTIAGFRSENRSSDLNMVMVLKEIVDRDLHDLDQEIEDWQKSAMDFERDFEVALRNGQQRQLAERINRVREPETREKMGKAIEELKQRVHDEMEELDVEHEQWNANRKLSGPAAKLGARPGGSGFAASRNRCAGGKWSGSTGKRSARTQMRIANRRNVKRPSRSLARHWSH